MLCYQSNVRVCISFVFSASLPGLQSIAMSRYHILLSVINHLYNLRRIILYHCCIKEHSTIALRLSPLFDNPEKISTFMFPLYYYVNLIKLLKYGEYRNYDEIF